MLGNQISLTNNVAKQVISVTATQNQTDFTVEGGYRINQLGVYRNGVRQVDGRDYIARNGSTVTLVSQGANAGDAMEFVVFDDFRVADALSVNTGGTINASVNITGALQMGTGTSIFSPAENELTLGTNSAERVRVSAGGSVGIGTDNPNRKLVIAGDAGTGAIQLKRTNAAVDGNSYGTIWFRNADDVDIALIRSRRESAIDDSNICFETTESGQSRSEKVRITSDGSVGIATTNPGRPLHVSSTLNNPVRIQSSNTYSRIEFESSATTRSDNVSIGADGNDFRIFTGTSGGATRAIVKADGKVGIGTIDPTRDVELNRPSGNAFISTKSQNTGFAGLLFGDQDADNRGQVTYSNNIDALILHTSGTEQVRITGLGSFGIGTNNPTHNLQLGDGTVDSRSVLKFGKRVSSAQSNLPLIGHHSHDGTASGLALCATSSSGCIYFFTGNDSDGFGDGSNSERLRILSGGGITFNGDSASANALNDYEEGTYTPTITLGSGSITTNHDDALSYVKVGRLVHVQGRIHLTLSSSNVSSFSITLPFTNCTALTEQSEDTSAVTHVIRATDAGTNVAGIRHFRFTANSATVEMNNADGANTGNFGVTNPHINVNFQYRSL